MTEQEFNELYAQVEENTNAIQELKEAFATLDSASPAASANESLLQALQETCAAMKTSLENGQKKYDDLDQNGLTVDYSNGKANLG